MRRTAWRRYWNAGSDNPIGWQFPIAPGDNRLTGVMQDREPTIRARILGEGFRRALENARLTGKAAAHQLDWNESKLSRMLSGKRPVSEVDAASLLAVCRGHGEERDRLVSTAGEHATPGFLRVHERDRPVATQLAEMIENETLATKVVNCQDLLVPGLLQTKDYAIEVVQAIARVRPAATGRRPGGDVSPAAQIAGDACSPEDHDPRCTRRDGHLRAGDRRPRDHSA